jgi:DNA-binding beta-propeller fold protein YncE
MASSQVEGTVLGHRGRVTLNRALKLSVRSLALILPILANFLMPHQICAQIVTETVEDRGEDGKLRMVGPYAVAVNPSTNKIYVANYTVPGFTVISGLNNIPVTVTFSVPPGETWYPNAVAVNPVNNKVYVVIKVSGGTGNGIVKIFEGSTNNFLAEVTVGKMPAAVAVNPVNNMVYVANNGSNNVTVIDGDTNSPTTLSAALGDPAWDAPIAIAVNEYTGKVYVVNNGDVGNVTVIDANNNIKTPQVRVGTGPKAIAVNADTNKVYVVNNGSGTVTVIDGETDIPDTTSLTVGTLPIAVAVNSSTNRIYVAKYNDSGTVSVINGATATSPATVSGTVNVGNSPVALAVNSGTNKVYVANFNSDNVTVIDGITNTPTTLVAPSGQVWNGSKAVAVNPETNKVYVANQYSNNVTVIQAFYSVSINKTGSGEGTVTSLPVGIDCGVKCLAVFPEGPAAVLLSQSPDTNSGFNGWGGGACSGTGGCGFSMLSDKVVSADFILSPWVKNLDSGVAFSDVNALQNAYNDASDGNLIGALVGDELFTGGWLLDKGKDILLKGGYLADYDSRNDFTILKGRLTIKDASLDFGKIGSLRADGLKVRP